MWCSKCQADVAAEVSSDNQRVNCTICATLLSTVDLPPARPMEKPASDKTKDARELLQRWSSGQPLDLFGPPSRSIEIGSLPSTPSITTATASTEEPLPPSPSTNVLASGTSVSLPASPMTVANPVASSGSHLEVLAAQSVVMRTPSVPVVAAIPNPLKGDVANEPTTATTSSSPLGSSPIVPVHAHPVWRVDASHARDLPAGSVTPEPSLRDAAGPFGTKATIPAESSFDNQTSRLWCPNWDSAGWRANLTTSNNWTATAGQLLAYVGVIGLTAGGCLVIWSFFGGPANYAPTGWLLTTAGQMLLFFGVVTLVSGGLDQTTEQVTMRIEQLGDHIIRIEQAAREFGLRGDVPPNHFPRETDASIASSHERAVVEE
jgi:hypothetical protein